MARIRLTTLRCLVIAGGVLLAGAVTTTAHHSSSMFDQTKQVTLVGSVTEFQWTNPHAYIEIDVPDDKGVVKHWSVELGSPSILMQSGWKFKDLKHGDKVTLRISPLRDGKPGGEGLDADLDGTEERDSPQLTPSLRQFVRECPEPMWFSCIATGVLTFVLCVGNTRSRERPLTMLRFVGNTVAALLVCLFLGQILVLLHVPNGH